MSMFYIEKPENSVDLEETTKELQNIEKRYKKFIKKNKKDVKNRIYKNFLLPVLNRGIKQMERNKEKNKVHLYWGKDVFCLINQTEKNRRVPDIIETMIRTGTSHYSISIEGKLLRMGMIPDGIDIPKKPKEKRAKYKLPTNRKEDRKMFHLLLHYFNPDRAKENENPKTMKEKFEYLNQKWDNRDLEDAFFKEVCTDGRMDPEKVLAYHLPKNQKEDKRLFRLLCNYFNVDIFSLKDETINVLFDLLTTEGRMDPAKLLSYLAISKSSHLRCDPDTGLIIPWYADTSDEEPEESVEDVKESPKEESEEDATVDMEESEESSDAEEEPISEDSSDEEERSPLYLNEIQHRHPLDPRTFPKYHKGLNKDQFEELLKECLTDLPKTDDDPTIGFVVEKMIDKMVKEECPQDPAFGEKLRRLAKTYAEKYNIAESNELSCALLLMALVPRTQYTAVCKIIRKYIVGVDGYLYLKIGNLGLDADDAIDAIKEFMSNSMKDRGYYIDNVDGCLYLKIENLGLDADDAIDAIKEFIDDIMKKWGHYIDKYRTVDYLRNPFYQHGRYIYVAEEIGVDVDEVIDGAIYCAKTLVVTPVDEPPGAKTSMSVRIKRAHIEPSGGNEAFDEDDSFQKYITANGAVYMEELGLRILSELDERKFSMLDDRRFHRMIPVWMTTKRPESADLYVPDGEEVEEE